MIHYYTNRECAKKLEVNLARWKRWSRAFLPPDPLGGLQSGYARQYTFKDLVKVYVGGHLLSHLKLSVADSLRILSDISPWLKKNGFLEINGPGTAARTATCRIYFVCQPAASGGGEPHVAYLMRRTLAGETIPGEEGWRRREVHDEVCIATEGGQNDECLLDHPDVHLLNLSAIYSRLVERLQTPTV